MPWCSLFQAFLSVCKPGAYIKTQSNLYKGPGKKTARKSDMARVQALSGHVEGGPGVASCPPTTSEPLTHTKVKASFLKVVLRPLTDFEISQPRLYLFAVLSHLQVFVENLDIFLLSSNSLQCGLDPCYGPTLELKECSKPSCTRGTDQDCRLTPASAMEGAC